MSPDPAQQAAIIDWLLNQSPAVAILAIMYGLLWWDKIKMRKELVGLLRKEQEEHDKTRSEVSDQYRQLLKETVEAVKNLTTVINERMPSK